MSNAYRDDLAYIHDTGYGDFAGHAGRFLVDELARAGVRGGTVVELGCGSGISARVLRDAGHDVLGIDLSEALVDMARRRVPDATFHVGSFVDADLPGCVAVTAIGEVLNYGFDEANGAEARAALFGRVHAALAPGGRLVFDVATPARAPRDGASRSFTEGPDWAVLVHTEAHADGRALTRRITSFRRVGELFRRDVETHRLELLEPQELAQTLRRIGFSVRTLPGYGAQPMLPGVVGFLAVKPGAATGRPPAADG